MLQQILTLSQNTFIESIRQPIYVVLLLVGSVGLWLNTQLAGYTFGEDDKMMIDLGLSMLFLTGLALAAFSATGVLTAEIENRTVLTVVSKPVARPLFVLGKFVGVSAAIAVAFWILTATFLGNIRHEVLETVRDPIDWPVIIFAASAFLVSILIATLGNYFYHWVFTSSFVFCYFLLNTLALMLIFLIDKEWKFQSITFEFTKEDSHLGQIMIALMMVFEALIILTSVAIAISTRLSQVMTLVVCVGVFLLGLISNSIHAEYGKEHIAARFLYWILPNLQYLWQADALTAGHAISFNHLMLVSGYCILYITAFLCLSITLFQTREVG